VRGAFWVIFLLMENGDKFLVALGSVPLKARWTRQLRCAGRKRIDHTCISATVTAAMVPDWTCGSRPASWRKTNTGTMYAKDI
jgi:hypothetical protein